MNSAQMLLRKRTVCALMGVSPSTLDRLRKAGRFPAPVKVSDQVIAWPRAAVEQWLEQLSAESETLQ